MLPMALVAWISLLFFVVAFVGSLIVAAVHGLRTWRIAGSFSGAATPALDDVMRGASKAEARATSLSEKSEKLNAAVARLQESLAQLAVLRSAADEVLTSVRTLGAFVPRK
jgi:hypothetical protein